MIKGTRKCHFPGAFFLAGPGLSPRDLQVPGFPCPSPAHSGSFLCGDWTLGGQGQGCLGHCYVPSTALGTEQVLSECQVP